ncbi:alpha/beta-type small acid-soluble spore protein [Metabacillus sp. HB246100]|uniref:alpha/beta-type small acid-soluble spore protein n=1 Tax=Bacillus weihaiensis TaxID=1547283 RepID=UPI003D59D60D
MTNQQEHRRKFEIAHELGIPLHKGNNGELTSKQAGKIGGRIGGNIVKEMIKHSEEQLKNHLPK